MSDEAALPIHEAIAFALPISPNAQTCVTIGVLAGPLRQKLEEFGLVVDELPAYGQNAFFQEGGGSDGEEIKPTAQYDCVLLMSGTCNLMSAAAVKKVSRLLANGGTLILFSSRVRNSSGRVAKVLGGICCALHVAVSVSFMRRIGVHKINVLNAMPSLSSPIFIFERGDSRVLKFAQAALPQMSRNMRILWSLPSIMKYMVGEPFIVGVR